MVSRASVIGVGLPLLVGLVHVALVARAYQVGSFDDDASYVLGAKALLAGHGLTARLTSGEFMVGLYPPGYSALIGPLVWLFPHTYLPIRLLSVACYAAVFPLTWRYLAGRGISDRWRAAALLILALGPPFATFGSMVMAETPFLVVLLLALVAVDRWVKDRRVLGRWGLAVIVAAASLIWLKQAAIGLVVGLALWLPFSPAIHRRVKAAALVLGVAAFTLPVLIARAVEGIPLAGARYSAELGGFYQGGLVNRLIHVFPKSGWHMLATAIPATIVPYLEPLPIRGHWPDLWKVVSWQVTIFVVVGAITWARRHRDAAVAMTLAYMVESVLWPYVNERRAILVLPLLVGWYVIGAARAWTVVRSVVRNRPRARAGFATFGSALVAVFVLVPLVAQVPRDYLFPWGQSSSQFAGSRYVQILRHLGTPSDVVETDYQSSTALFTGHRTNWTAFLWNQPPVCYLPAALAQLASDHARYLLLGDINKPGVIDNACLATFAQTGDWAVPLLNTRRDDASVYQLVGPATGNPGLVDVLSGATASASDPGPVVTLTWTLAAPAQVSQVSLGQATYSGAPTSSVSVEVESPDGSWTVVERAGGAVGDGGSAAPYLLRSYNRPIAAVAFRVIVVGGGPGDGSAWVTDLAAVGPAASS